MTKETEAALIRLKEIEIILGALSNQYGVGYNHDPTIAGLQAKLSIERELLHRIPDEGDDS